MDGRRISLAIILICGCATTTQSPAYGVWNRPGTLAQYIGYGTGAGLHAPLGCNGNCNRTPRRQPMAISNGPTYAVRAMPHVQQFAPAPNPTATYGHGNYQHGPTLPSYSPQPTPATVVPQNRPARPALPLPKTSKPKPTTKSEALPAPAMPSPEPLLFPAPVPTS